MNKIYYPEKLTGNLSSVLEEAMQEDYNREREWLWVADEVPNTREREYCLRRALYINPTNRKTQHRLETISKDRFRKTKNRYTFWRGFVRLSSRRYFFRVIRLLKAQYRYFEVLLQRIY